ncbi:Thrombospondin type 1 domain protein [Aphelenchoides bicaudatus]|nr:Thrombospondin type 1 domain protein [Aphelenchoides bicaudatus]
MLRKGHFLLLVLLALIGFVSANRQPRACPRVRVVRPEWLYGEWSDWSPCSKTCGGGGLQHRRRQCADNNPGCLASETRPCGQRPCAPGWSEWCEWEGCRATCGTGERMRVRFCEGGTLRCPGKDFQISRCNAGVPCPGFYDWSSWSQCSTSCGMGVRHRERTCFDEYECRGNKTEAQACNEGPCNRYRHGQWSGPCDGGTMHRQRQCHPSREHCPGTDVERQRCNDFPCHSQHRLPRPFDPRRVSSAHCVWTTWTGWSGCSAPSHYRCDGPEQGRGQRWRQRYCVRADVRSECEHHNRCDGSGQQTEVCALDPRSDPCRRG